MSRSLIYINFMIYSYKVILIEQEEYDLQSDIPP